MKTIQYNNNYNFSIEPQAFFKALSRVPKKFCLSHADYGNVSGYFEDSVIFAVEVFTVYCRYSIYKGIAKVVFQIKGYPANDKPYSVEIPLFLNAEGLLNR